MSSQSLERMENSVSSLLLAPLSAEGSFLPGSPSDSNYRDKQPRELSWALKQSQEHLVPHSLVHAC